MKPLSCGIVPGPRRIVAVVLGPDGRPRRAIRSALTDDARAGLVAYLAATGVDIVVTDAFARADSVATRAVDAGQVVWVVPEALVAAIARATATTGPERIAAVLARLPRIPFLRAQLRRLQGHEPRQAALL